MLAFLIIFAVAITGLIVVQVLDVEYTKHGAHRGKATRSAPVALFCDTMAGLR